MSWTNYHSHCHYCDGKGAPDAHVEAALRLGMPAFGFSSHAPIRFSEGWLSNWNMPAARLPEYMAHIRRLQQEYAGQIALYAGLEVDYVPGCVWPGHPGVQSVGPDYTIGSVHYAGFFSDGRGCELDGPHGLFLEGVQHLFQGDVRQMVEHYFELTRQMVRLHPPDVVGHLDKIKMQSEGGRLFDERAPWYRQALEQTLHEIIQAGPLVEINTRGVYKKATEECYPAPWVVEELHRHGAGLVLNSDSHTPEELVKGFPAAASWLEGLGVRHLYVFCDGAWVARPFSAAGVIWEG